MPLDSSKPPLNLEAHQSTLATQRSDSSSQTVASSSPRLDESDATSKDPFLVTWESPDDPLNPFNWGFAFRCYLTFLGALLLMHSCISSSAPVGIATNLQDYLRVSDEVLTLLIALFVAGYCAGPLFWGPLATVIGRRPVFILSFLLYTGFQVGAALSKNTASILVFRFLGGVSGAAPWTNSNVLIADIWPPKERGLAIMVLSVCSQAGPAVAPLIGGYISVSGASWRWTFWALAISSGVLLIAIVLTLPETGAQTILNRKAKRMRNTTGDDRFMTESERRKPTLGALVHLVLVQPWKVFIHEPMLIAITVYMAFVYGCLLLLFESYPIVFVRDHGLNAGEAGLAFLPLLVGNILAISLIYFFYTPRYARLVQQYAPKPVPPEARLPMAIPGGITFALAFFWFGWTSYPSLSVWASLPSGAVLSFGVALLFVSLFNYVVDTYLEVAGSALAANTVGRSLTGASFPLFATQMYEKLGPRWASTLLGLIALIMVPVPVAFIRFGPWLRSKSTYSPNKVGA